MATLGDPGLRAAAGPPGGGGGAPAAASARAYLRAGLPAIYHDGGLAMRFVGGLETLLDPVVAILDALDHYIEPDLAPADMLGLLAAWLGLEPDEAWPEERTRELVRRAGELHRLRGTRGGLELALSIAFPETPIRIEDRGGVTWSRAPGAAAGARSGDDGFVVYCDVPLEDPAVLAQAVERLRPAHVHWLLRIRTEDRAGS